MITEIADIDREALRLALHSEWDTEVPALDFLPVGGDSWSYRAGDLFINVREARGQRKPWNTPRDIGRSLLAACALRERAGLEFMLTPRPTVSGPPLARVGRFAVTLFPYIPGRMSYGTSETEGTVTLDAEIASWVERLHAATPTIDDMPLDVETFRPDYPAVLRAAIDRSRDDRDAGPYSSRVRDLIEDAHGDVLDALHRHEEHAARLRSRDIPFVVTHGEPAGNVLIAEGGERYLIDLVEIARGPRERDLQDQSPDLRDESADEDVISYYKQNFVLSEITEYADRLSRPHEGDGEDARAWHWLCHYVAEARSV